MRGKLLAARRVLVIVKLILSGFLLLCISGSIALYVILVPLGEMLDSETCSPDNPENAIEEIAHFQLPPSAQNLTSRCGGMQGWFAFADFDIEPNELEQLVESTMVNWPLTDTSATERDGCGLSLVGHRSYLYGYYGEPEFRQWVTVDTTEPEQYHVYICVLGG